MKNNISKLADAELDIMMVLWSAGKPLTSNEVLQGLVGKRNWKLATLMTTMDKMAKQGVLHIDRTTRNNLYSPILNESEYKAFEGQTFLAKLFGNSMKSMVNSLYEGEVLSESDLQELQDLLDQKKAR